MRAYRVYKSRNPAIVEFEYSKRTPRGYAGCAAIATLFAMRVGDDFAWLVNGRKTAMPQDDTYDSIELAIDALEAYVESKRNSHESTANKFTSILTALRCHPPKPALTDQSAAEAIIALAKTRPA